MQHLNWFAAVRALRPAHWIKNGFIFAPAFFAQKFPEFLYDSSIWLTLLSFSLASSLVYIFNDWSDLEYDREHPLNKIRPMAAGLLSRTLSLNVFLILSICLLGTLFVIKAWLPVLIYVGMNLLYSQVLKNLIILDLIVVSFGFILRLWAGALASEVVLSLWLIGLTFLLALCLILSKRRSEILLWTEGLPRSKILIYKDYLQVINGSIYILVLFILVLYWIYCSSNEVTSRFNNDHIYYTFLFVLPGAWRYLYLIHYKPQLTTPIDMILKDQLIQFCIVGWLVTFYLLIY